MSHFDRHGTTVQERERRRPSGSRFGELSGRLARTFGTERERPRPEPRPALAVWEDDDAPPFPVQEDESTEPWDAIEAAFPLVRNGYDPESVDEYIANLEREIDELRVQTDSQVAAELGRVGEQTSSILLLAHEKAKEITRTAQVQADKCLADAASNALTITEQANQKLRTLDVETESVWEERARLLEDARATATALAALVDQALRRFPAEPERSTIAISAFGPNPVESPQADEETPSADQAGEQPPDPETY